MYEFKYTPENGYYMARMSRDEHNKLFERRQVNIWQSYTYAVNEDKGHIVMMRHASPLAIVLSILAYPFIMLIHGIANYKEINDEYRGALNWKRRGSFSCDEIRKCKSDSLYQDVISKLTKK
ncbi:hypothetical protein phiA005_0050 [Aeromonas phage phiA005]|nr:hypothetical protein phiA005_0050 [Aeromonas phage phiA005]